MSEEKQHHHQDTGKQVNQAAESFLGDNMFSENALSFEPPPLQLRPQKNLFQNLSKNSSEAKQGIVQRALNRSMIRRAIAYNRVSYNRSSTMRIQEHLGIEVSGEFNEETVLAIASFQQANGLREDGRLGGGTYDALLSRAGPVDGRTENCITLFQLVGPRPLRFFRDTPALGNIGSMFRIRIRFDPRCKPEDWEYRQYIRGNVEHHDNHGVVTPLNNRFLIPGGIGLTPGWQEDGDTSVPAGQAGHKYGHRSYRAGGDGRDRYLPHRSNGYIYEGRDFPVINPVPAAPGDSGDFVVWNMFFRGTITRKGEGVVQEKYWSIRGRVVIP